MEASLSALGINVTFTISVPEVVQIPETELKRIIFNRNKSIPSGDLTKQKNTGNSRLRGKGDSLVPSCKRYSSLSNNSNIVFHKKIALSSEEMRVYLNSTRKEEIRTNQESIADN